MEIARGQRLKLNDVGLDGSPFVLNVSLGGSSVFDCACFGLDAQRKLSDERYMVFFNQPMSPCGAIKVHAERSFAFDLARLPSSIDALVITVALDGPGTMASLGSSQACLMAGTKTAVSLHFDGTVFNAERAIMLIEFYRKDGLWRLSAVCQGFNGGLDALVKHFGGTVADEQTESLPAHIAVATTAARLSLEKRLQHEAPHLVSLVKKASISLEKVGLSAHKARVCLCLDISGSMSDLYSEGVVQRFAERILALACRFDDDGEIDVFLFGSAAHQSLPMSLGNSRTYMDDLLDQYPLEGDTRYGLVMEHIRRFYFDGVHAQGPHQIKSALTPVYVMFVTDGETSDKSKAECELIASSKEPIFWQFMGIGQGQSSNSWLLQTSTRFDFPFLEKLDELSGRFIDNANFFSISSPDEYADDTLYDLLMNEYPDWVKQARALGMFP